MAKGEKIYGPLIVDSDFTLGLLTTSGADRTITATGSATDVGFSFVPKGAGLLLVPTGYEANLASEGRALVNKAYADGFLAGKTITSPGASEDGKIPQYDHGSTSFIFVTPSGGGGGGSVTFGADGQIPFMNVGGTDFTYSSSVKFDTTNAALTVGASRIFTIGTDNLFIGEAAGNFTLSSQKGTAVGKNTLTANTTGSRNTAVGYNALKSITTSGNNVAVGSEAMELGVGISASVAIGVGALQNATGGNNISVGYQSGNALTSGVHNIIIGYNIDAPIDAGDNQLTIQNIIFGTGLTVASQKAISPGFIGIGTNSPDRRFHVELDSAATTTVTYVQRLTSTSSGTPAVGIGVGIEFEVETSVGNNEVGGTIEVVASDVTGSSEDFDLVFNLMRAGAPAAQVMRITPIGGGTSIRLTTPGFTEIVAGGNIQLTNTLINGNIKAGITGDSTIDRRLHVEENISSGTATLYPIRMTSISTGSISNGFGVGIEFEAETTSGNNEVGATIEAIITDTTSTSEDFDLVFKTMVAGAAATEHLRFGSNKIGFFGATTVVKQTGGVATAGALYTATEQGMINAMYTALQNYGLLT